MFHGSPGFDLAQREVIFPTIELDQLNRIPRLVDLPSRFRGPVLQADEPTLVLRSNGFARPDNGADEGTVAPTTADIFLFPGQYNDNDRYVHLEYPYLNYR